MATSFKQVSFAGGQLGATMLSRHDQTKYAEGAQLLSNFLVRKDGSLANRPGTVYLDTMGYVQNGIPWSSSTQYGANQTVTSGGVTYLCLVTNTNQPPASSPVYWSVLNTATLPVRPIKFVFSNTVTYELVFSINNVRIYKNGVQIAVPTTSISAWNGSSIYYPIGSLVSYSGGYYIAIAGGYSIAPGNTLIWKQVTPNAAGAIPLDIPLNGGTLELPYVVVTMPQAALPVLQAANYNDIMTVVSSYCPPFQITRTSDYVWAVTPLVIASSINPPTSATLTPGVGYSGLVTTPTGASASGGTGATVNYSVTAFNASGESLGSSPYSALTPSVAHPVTVTWTAVSGAAGYIVYSNVGGNYGIVGASSTTSFTDTGQGNAYPVHVPPTVPTGPISFVYVVTAISLATGEESPASPQATGIGSTPTAIAPNVINWTAVSGASTYNVYRLIAGIPGLIGTTTATSFQDTNIQPNYSDQPPLELTNPDGSPLFTGSANWPSVIAYFQQRLLLAATPSQPITVWGSRVGIFTSFSVHTPVEDADAFSFVIAAKSAQPIIAMLDLQKLIIHTQASEYACTGNSYGTVTPSAINCILQGNVGATLPVPVTIKNADIFVQSLGSQVHDLRFEIASYTYTGKDLTLFNHDMFNGITVVDMDYQQIPDSIVWMAMSNGTLYGLTYVPDQQLWAWHQHVFQNGFVENVCVVTNDAQNVLYLIVRRTINGATVRYLESLSPRDFADVTYYSDWNGTDCSLTYNGTATDGSTVTVTSTDGSWTPNDLMTITATAAHFAASDVTNANQVVLSQYSTVAGQTNLVDSRIAFRITAYVSATQVQGYPLGAVPTWAQGLAVSTWGKAVTQFAGLTQLAGQAISVLADGCVAASPLNPAYPTTVTVSGTGTFALPSAALVVTAGLPVQADLQIMPLENAQGETVFNKHQVVKEVTPIYASAIGGLYGQDSAHLNAAKQARGTVLPPTFAYGQPPALLYGPLRVPIQGASQTTGQVWVRVVDPLPFALAGIITTTEVGNG